MICLLALTTAVGLARVKIVNEGVPGENSVEVDARLDRVLARVKPQYVVIFVGMNDAVNDHKFLQPHETELHVSAMVKRSRAAGAQVILVSVHEPDVVRLLQRHSPAAYGSRPPEWRIRELNDVLKDCARRDHATVADFYTGLSREGGANVTMSTDGVHLTAKGYALLAATVRKALPEHIDSGSTILCIGDSLTYGIGVRPAGGGPESTVTYPAQLQFLLR